MNDITREEWEKAVDKVLEKNDEPKSIIDARKKFFMDLFDTWEFANKTITEVMDGET